MISRLLRSIMVSFTALLASVGVMDARTITAEDALARVIGCRPEFNTMSVGARSEYKLKYTSPEAAYYVFSNEDKGCIVVSGDDRVTPLLAEIPTPYFDPDSLAPGAAWLLEIYRSRIASLSPDKGYQTMSTSSNDVAALYTHWTDVAPLMSCSWNQHSPYNALCPLKYGSRSLTGCVATAMAQIIRTIGYAQCSGYIVQGTGSERVEYDYDNTPIDFDNLLPAYNSGDTEESKLAVARLMLACGLSVGMNYSPSSSGAQSSQVESGLIQNFGYDKTHTRYLSRSEFGTAKWEGIIYAELSLGRPVYYSASSGVSEGHAFVIDGYRREGMWHINWGWGGRSDGYFSLSLLTPSTINYGDTNSGYNIDQKLVKAVPPGVNPGVVLNKMFGSITKASEGRYQVYYSGNGVAYNHVSLGAAIAAEGSDDVLAWIPFWTDQSIGASMSVRDYYNYDFSDISLPAGIYRIYPAIMEDGAEEAVICAESEGRQHYVSLIVSMSGKYDISNPDSNTQPAKYELYLSEVLTPKLYSGYESELRYVVVNNGGADYIGTILLQLVPEGDTTPVYQKTILGNVISAGFNKLMSTVFYATDSNGNALPAGNYYIRLTNTGGDNLLMEPSTETVMVVDELPPGMHYGGGLTEVMNSTMMPKYLVNGESWPHIPYINNEREGTIRLDVVFCRPESNMPVKRYNVYNREMGSVSGTQHIEPFTVELPFGIYEVSYEANNIDISDRRTVFVGDRVGDHYYMPISAGNAALCRHPEYGYSGDVTIASEITVEGSNYTVTDIAEDAFGRCNELNSVIVPSTVKHIGRNAFTYCPNLHDIVFDAEEVPFGHRNHVMPGADESLAVYAPAKAYDGYSDVLNNYHPVYSKIEKISSASVLIDKLVDTISIAITPIHPEINTEFKIERIDSGFSPIEVTSADVKDQKLRLAVKAAENGTAQYLIRSVQPGVEPGSLEIKVATPAALTEIDVDDVEDGEESVYDLQGRRVEDRRGFRIVLRNGKAKVIKY